MRRFANDFHSWLRHSWKLLANRLTSDPKGDLPMIFTRENYWQIASRVTQKSLFTVTNALFFISPLLTHWRYCSLALSDQDDYYFHELGDIHGCYSLVKIAFAPICACKNNRRIWRHNASVLHSLDVTDQLWWRHNTKSEKTVLSDNGEISDR